MSAYLTEHGEMNLTLGEFRRRLKVVFEENEEQPLPNTALRSLLLEADRLAEEHMGYIAPTPSYEQGRAAGLEEAARVATAAGERITEGKAGIESNKDGGAYYVAALLRCLATPSTAAASQVQEREPARCPIGWQPHGMGSPWVRCELEHGHQGDHQANVVATSTAEPAPAHPPSAPPGERTWQQERAAVVAFVRSMLDFGHGKDCYCPLCQEVPDVASAIERGDHLPVPTQAAPGGEEG